MREPEFCPFCRSRIAIEDVLAGAKEAIWFRVRCEICPLTMEIEVVGP